MTAFPTINPESSFFDTSANTTEAVYIDLNALALEANTSEINAALYAANAQNAASGLAAALSTATTSATIAQAAAANASTYSVIAINAALSANSAAAAAANSVANLATAIAHALPNSGVAYGTWNTVVVSTQGLVINATNTAYLLANAAVAFANSALYANAAGTANTAVLANSAIYANTSGSAAFANTAQVANTATSALVANSLANAITVNLTGDVSGSVSFGNTAQSVQALNATLANTGVSAGTWTQVVVNAKGLVISAANATSSNVSASVVLTGDITANGVTGSNIATSLANTGVSAGTYGNATQVASVTFDAKGRAISASNVAISYPTAPVSSVAGRMGSITLAVADVAGAIAAPISATGDVSGTSVANALTLTLASVGSPGTYAISTTDAKGRVVSGRALTSSDVTTALGFNPGTSNAAAYVLNSAEIVSALGYTPVSTVPVQSVFGRTGNVVLANTDVTTALGFTPLANAYVLNSAEIISALGYTPGTSNATQFVLNAVEITTALGFNPGTSNASASVVLTGDVTANGLTGSNVVTTLANTGVSAGTWTQVVVNTKGLVISASNATSSNVSASVVLTGDITANGVTGSNIATSLATTGVLAGTYGNATQVAAVTFDAKGRAISASNVAISYPTAPVSSVAGRTGSITLAVADVAGAIAAPAVVSGDVSGTSVANALTLTLASVGSPGTYAISTTDAKGRVISGRALASSDVTSALGFTPTSNAVVAAGYLPLSGGTLSGALTVTANAGVFGTINFNTNGSGNFPPVGSGAFTCNYSGGGAEVDFFNTTGTSSFTGGFSWYHMTSANSANKVMSIDAWGNAVVLGNLKANTVTTVTQPAGDNSTNAATTAWTRTYAQPVGSYLPLGGNGTYVIGGGGGSGTVVMVQGAYNAQAVIEVNQKVTSQPGYFYASSNTNSSSSTATTGLVMRACGTSGSQPYFRWGLVKDSTTESTQGTNIGSNFQLQRFSDLGQQIDTPLLIYRSNGVVVLSSNSSIFMQNAILYANTVSTITQPTADNSTNAATTAWTRTYGSSTYLPLSGGTVTGALTVNANTLTSGIIQLSTNLAGNLPPANTSGAIGWNYSNGGGELDIISTAYPGGSTGGINFYQMISSGVTNKLLSLDKNGNCVVGGNLTANTIVCVTQPANDNTNNAATTAWTRTYGSSTYLPLSGGTVTGALTVNANTGVFGTINFNTNGSGNFPPVGSGAFTCNYSGGGAEVDFFNTTGTSSFSGGFSWYHMTAANSATKVLSLDKTGVMTAVNNFYANAVIDTTATVFTPVTGGTITIGSYCATAVINPSGTINNLAIVLPTPAVSSGARNLQIIFVQGVLTPAWSGATLINVPSGGMSQGYVVSLIWVAALSAWIHATYN